MKKIGFLCLVVLLLSTFPCAASSFVSIRTDQPVVFETANPYINEQDRTMIPLGELDKVFPSGVSFSLQGNKITIVKELLGEKTTVTLQLGSKVRYQNGKPVQMDTAPVLTDGILFVPLKFIGDALGIAVLWTTGTSEVLVYPQVLRLFAWNEAEGTDPPRMRYSLQITTETVFPSLEEMQKNPIREETLRLWLQSLPPGCHVSLTLLYGIRSHKIPAEVRDAIFQWLSEEPVVSYGYLEECMEEIPPIVTHFSNFSNDWFSQDLYAMGMEPLSHSSDTIYRFTYFHSFFATYTIEITLQPDGTGSVHYVCLDGYVSSSQGIVIAEQKFSIDKAQMALMRETLADADFWNLPAEIDRSGKDGVNWLVEGVENGTYHAVKRWKPTRDDPVFTIGHLFMDFAFAQD